MIEKLDQEKFQQLVYYVNNVKMSSMQRDMFNRVLLAGILKGEIDTDDILGNSISNNPINNVEMFASTYMETAKGWVQADVMYGYYCSWCEENEQEPASKTLFGRTLIALGARRKKRSNANYYYFDGADQDLA